jgi:hypothetical protein
MAKIVEVELSLFAPEGSEYNVAISCRMTGSDELDEGSGTATIEPAKLALIKDADKYGIALGAALFADEDIRTCLENAQTRAKTAQGNLRLRLKLDARDPAQHTVRWETLRDAKGNELLTLPNLWFSRYPAAKAKVQVKSRPAAAMKALVIIASPLTLPEGVKAIPIEQEKLNAEAALSTLPEPPTVLARAPGAAGKPTAKEIKDRLVGGDFDLVYLLAHGGIVDGVPKVLLEDKDGNDELVSADDLIGAFVRTDNPVRLVVLASCESAGNGDTEDALKAFGPRLAAAGVPAVVAMQGEIKQDTAFLFLGVFFEQLMRHGQIDRAMAVARGRVVSDKRPDYWKPTLFLRLLSGSLWYAGFGDADDVGRWPTIRRALEQHPPECIPILGPGLTEDILGSTREIAQKLAEKNKFPLEKWSLEDLPTVTQYLAIHGNTTKFPLLELIDMMKKRLVDRFGNDLPAGIDRQDFNAVLSGVGKLRRAANPMDPHRVLASKPFRYYVTVNPDELMEDALREANRCPMSEYARWNSVIAAKPTVADEYPNYKEATVEHPLVYHLFGKFTEPDSLVITEDNYFDYLLRIVGNPEAKNRIANAVSSDMTLNALVFMGFRLDDWSFRVMLRSIYAKEGSGARAGDPKAWPCVGAQLLPEKDRIIDPEGTRAYFHDYLGSSKIDIYWGRVQDFIREFDHEMAGLTAGTDTATCAKGEQCCRQTAGS